MKPQCLGRFEFSLADEFAESGRSQSTYSVSVTTTPLGDRGADEIWLERVRAIQQLPPADQIAERNVRPVEIGPGYPAVYYHSNLAAPHLVTLEAHRALDSHVLCLKFEGKATEEEGIERLVALTAERYRPGASEGFCVGAGSLSIEPSGRERAFASFRDAKRQIDVSVRMDPPGIQGSTHPLEDVAEEKVALAEEGVRLDVLANDRRKVAELTGYEGRVLFASPEEGSQLRYTWYFEGAHSDARRPQILIKATAPQEAGEHLDQVWEGLLGSFRARK